MGDIEVLLLNYVLASGRSIVIRVTFTTFIGEKLEKVTE
jgi:hypothetical protein